MANKIRTPVTNHSYVSVPAIIETANLAKGLYVKITDDETVDQCALEDDVPIGFVLVPAKIADGKGTIQTRAGFLVDAQCKGAIAAGDRVKVGVTTAGVQTFKKWIAGNDNPALIVGICWVGGADTETGSFLIF